MLRNAGGFIVLVQVFREKIPKNNKNESFCFFRQSGSFDQGDYMLSKRNLYIQTCGQPSSGNSSPQAVYPCFS